MKVTIEMSGGDFLDLLREIKTQNRRAKIANRATYRIEDHEPDGSLEIIRDSVSEIVSEGK